MARFIIAASIDENASNTRVSGATKVIGLAVADMHGVVRVETVFLQGGVEYSAVRFRVTDAAGDKNFFKPLGDAQPVENFYQT